MQRVRTANNVHPGRLLLEKFGIVQVSIDQLDIGILIANFLAFLLIADKAGHLEFWVTSDKGVESVTTNVSSTSCAA
jgi:hypothetical protein